MLPIDIKYNICNLSIESKINAGLLKILLHRQYKRIILIVLGKLKNTEIRKSSDMMDESLEISLHFKS